MAPALYKKSSRIDSVFKPVCPELPQRVNTSQLLLLRRQADAVGYLWSVQPGLPRGEEGLPTAPCAVLTTKPTSTRATGLPFLCPAFCSNTQTTHRSILSHSAIPSLPSSDFSRNISECWVPLSTSFLTLCKQKRGAV